MRILIFGDSISEGFYDLEKGGWVNRLKLYFFEKNSDIYITNCGISGDNTQKILKRFKPYFDFYCKEKEAIIIFTIGVNNS